MKKSFMFAAALTFAVATTSYSQKTSTSTPSPSNQPVQGKTQETESAGQSKQTTAPPTGTSDKTNVTSQQAQKTSEDDASNRPGGELHKNANDVGRYSDNEDSKSMTHSKEALAERRKNLTESDTTVKKGSGSSPRNTKNHTGKTGNYENQAIKHDQKTQPRP